VKDDYYYSGNIGRGHGNVTIAGLLVTRRHRPAQHAGIAFIRSVILPHDWYCNRASA